MAVEKGLADFRPLFGQTSPEWKTAPSGNASGSDLRRSLFSVHAIDSCRLEVLVTDFHYLAFLRVLTLDDLENLRDEVGVGGSFSEFVDYLVACFSSNDVKLIMDGSSSTTTDSGVVKANLVAHKSKGLPRISLRLEILDHFLAFDASENLSLLLFKEFRKRNDDFLKEQERASTLAVLLSCEKEKIEILRKQLETYSTFPRKSSRSKPSDKVSCVPDSSTVATSEQQSSDLVGSNDPRASKVKLRAAPTSRRVKVRGAMLRPVDEDDENQP